MKRIAALDAKNRFGELLMDAQREPVAVEKHGKPVAVMMSVEEFDDLRAAKLRLLKVEVEKGLADVVVGRVVDGPKAFASLRERLK